MCNMAALRMTNKYAFKQASSRAFPVQYNRHFQNVAVLLKQNPKISKLQLINSLLKFGNFEACLLSLIWPLQWLFLPLPLHCTSYPRPVSTTAPNTLTDPLLPYPIDVTNIPPSIHKQIILHLSSPPLHLQAPSRASSGTDSTKPEVPLRL